MILLDTHVWLWWLLGDGQLTPSQRKRLDELAHQKLLAVSWVSIWELEMLERKQRVSLLPNLETWVRQATDPSFIQAWPVDMELVLSQRNLPSSFHSDPADRLITASAMLADCPLATFDQKIIQANCVEIWK